MKKLNFKRVLTAVLAVAMLATMFVLPTSAALPETTVQEWDFSGFTAENNMTGEGNATVVSPDGNVTIGGNSYWDNFGNISKSFDGSVYTWTKTANGYQGRPQYAIALKLNKDIPANSALTLVTDLYLKEKWVDQFTVYYRSEKDLDISRKTALLEDGKDTVLYSAASSNVLYKAGTKQVTLTTPAITLKAGGYIMIRTYSYYAEEATVSEFELKAQIPYAYDDNTAVYDEWDFTKIPDQNTSGQVVPQASSDERIILGNVNTYWNRNTTWDVLDGNVEFNSVSATAESKDNFSIGFKLDMDLKAGVTYNFVTDLDYTYISNEWAGKFDFYYTPNKDNNYLGENFLTNMPAGAVSLGGYTKTGGFSDIPSTFTFTPAEDLAAGGYLNIRYALWHSVNKLTISSAKITTAPTKVLRKYDFTTAEDRACVEGTKATTISEYTSGGTTVINWKQGGLVLNDFQFEAGKAYNIALEYAGVDTRKIILNKVSKEDTTVRSWVAGVDAILPSTGGRELSVLGSYAFDLLAPETGVDYGTETLALYNDSWDGYNLSVKSMTISEYTSKVAAKKADAIAQPTENNRLYTKIVLPAINAKLQQYAMVDADGNYTAIKGNTVTGLNYDTEYKFVVRYIDSYKYLAGDYSDAITVKTRKLGDVTGDEKVDIIDLVRIKKGLAEDPENAVYDIEPAGGEAGSLVYMRRIILGLVK